MRFLQGRLDCLIPAHSLGMLYHWERYSFMTISQSRTNTLYLVRKIMQNYGCKRPFTPLLLHLDKKTQSLWEEAWSSKNLGVEWSCEEAMPWMFFFHFPDSTERFKLASALKSRTLDCTVSKYKQMAREESTQVLCSSPVPERKWSQSSQEKK